MADDITNYTLSEFLQDMYFKLGVLRETTATGGSATTAVDGLLAELGEDDDWKGGALFVVRDAGGASAAPEGKFANITSYTNSTGTFNFDTITDAIASGDLFAYTDEQVPLFTAIRQANEGLQNLGDMDLVDTTTLDTATSQKEYTLSLPWKRRVKRVEIQTTSDSNSNDWRVITGWRQIPATAGSTGLIEFTLQPAASKDLRITYEGRHPRLVTYDDVVREGVNPALAAHAGYFEMLAWMNNQRRGEDDYLVEQLNSAEIKLINLKSEFPIRRSTKQSRLNVVNRTYGR